MKKAIQINLAGRVFHIDEDAYDKLRQYLDALKKKFKKSEEGEEIIQDIEARMAELFEARLKSYKQVVTLRDVEQVIEVLGQPEDIADEEEPEEPKGEKRTGHSYQQDRSRRLYRDQDRAILAGICAGLGAYLRVDPVIIRIIFIVLALLSAFTLIVVYLVLWFIIPPAETTAQKLEMKGEKVTVENIEKTIKEEYEKVKENFKNFKKSKEFRRSREVAHNMAHGFEGVIHAFLRILGWIIGFAFIIAGIVVIIALVGVVVFREPIFRGFFGIDIFPLNDFLTIFIDTTNIQLFKVGLMLLIFIPLLSIIIGGVRLMLGAKSKSKALGVTGFVFWFMGLIIVVSILFMEGQVLAYEGETVRSESFSHPKNKTLHLTRDEEMYYYVRSGKSIYLNHNRVVLKPDTDEGIYLISRLDIEMSENDKYEVEIEYYSRGKNKEEAEINCRKVKYAYELKKNTLELDPYYTLVEGGKYRFQKIEVNIKVPLGAHINISQHLNSLLDDIYCPYTLNRWDLYDKDVVMTTEGLVPSGKQVGH